MKQIATYAIGALWCLSAQADLLYTSGAPADLASSITSVLAADDFTLASDASVEGVTFYAMALSTFDVNAAKLSYTIFSDKDGHPFTALATGDAQAPSVEVLKTAETPTHEVAAQMAVRFNLTNPVQLNSDTRYWLALHAGSNYALKQPQYVRWNLNAADSNNFPQGSMLSLDGGLTWLAKDEGRAFAVLGSTTPVPEASTGWLACIGLVSLALVASTRRR